LAFVFYGRFVAWLF